MKKSTIKNLFFSVIITFIIFAPMAAYASGLFSTESKGCFTYDEDKDGTPDIRLDAGDIDKLSQSGNKNVSDIATLQSKYEDLSSSLNTLQSQAKQQITDSYNNGYTDGSKSAIKNLKATSVSTIYNYQIGGDFGKFHHEGGGEGYTPGQVTINLSNYGVTDNDIVVVTGSNFYSQQSNYGDLSSQYSNIPAATYSYSRNGNILTISANPYVQDKVWFYGSEWEGWRCIASNIQGSVFVVHVQ